jgi:hypothetical protein
MTCGSGRLVVNLSDKEIAGIWEKQKSLISYAGFLAK